MTYRSTHEKKWHCLWKVIKTTEKQTIVIPNSNKSWKKHIRHEASRRTCISCGNGSENVIRSKKIQTVLHVNLLATTFVFPKSLLDLGCLIPSVGLRLPHRLTPSSGTFSFQCAIARLPLATAALVGTAPAGIPVLNDAAQSEHLRLLLYATLHSACGIECPSQMSFRAESRWSSHPERRYHTN